MNIRNKKLLVITGLSGAGMSSALKNMEDLGYEVFDNFPLTLVEPLLQDSHTSDNPIAIGIDTRTRGFSSEAVLTVVEQLEATLLFITADDSILQKRFTETRRRHPMAKDRSVDDGIKKERGLLHNLKNKADLIIDTSSLSIHDLRRILEGHFKKENQGKLTVTLLSFGFRWGLPREADIVMDVRFLQNPYWVKELQSLNGNDSAVGAYIAQDESLQPFINGFKEMIAPVLPRYVLEGKSYLTIAFGCTGGRHRSVFLIETLKPWLQEQGFAPNVFHRDIAR
ncbi:MAG: RNase adapter RapZ [Betaproteobacteria bacterium]|nr:RNase adapter RapZ [Betaproteobacteria bacterium]